MEYHYLYQIVSLVPDENGVCKIYSGVRTSEVEPEIDDYFGSGTWITAAVAKHGRDKFIKTVVAKFDTRLEADICETQWLDKLFYNFYGGDWTKFNRQHYNLKLNIKGREGFAFSEETRRKQSEKTKSLYASGWKSGTYGVPVPDERRQKISDTLKGKYAGEKNPMYGKTGELSSGWERRGEESQSFKGISVGTNRSTGKIIVFDGRKSMEARGFHQGAISSSILGKSTHHKNFTFIRTTDEQLLRQLLAEDNFHDEQSKTIVQNFLK